MTVNQVRGIGICYTNIDEILVARKVAQALEQQDAQKAFDMTNFEDGYNQIMKAVGERIETYESYLSDNEYYAEVLDKTAEEYCEFLYKRKNL